MVGTKNVKYTLELTQEELNTITVAVGMVTPIQLESTANKYTDGMTRGIIVLANTGDERPFSALYKGLTKLAGIKFD